MPDTGTATATAESTIRRLDRPGDLGWVVMAHGELYDEEFGLDTSFEALVARIVADYANDHDDTREAAWIAAIGVASGTVGALALGRLIASMLYGLKAWDPATLIGSALLLAFVALGAGWIPAHRAATVDPMQALRHE